MCAPSEAASVPAARGCAWIVIAILLALTATGVLVYLRLLESGRLGVVFR